MISTEDLDVECAFGNLLEYRLRIERAVIIANAGVVPSNDQVRSPNVLPEHGMQHRFTGARKQHVKAVAVNHYGIFREILVHHLANTGIADGGGNIACLEFAK